MKLKLESRHYLSIGLGVIALIFSFLIFSKTPFFLLFLGLSILIMASQFIMDIIIETYRQADIDRNFPEFVRNFVSGVRSGMPVTQAVIGAADNDYGSLNPYVQRLKRQLKWHVPFHRAFRSFAEATGNDIIRRAVSTVIEAERAGGDIGDVLSSITGSLIQIKKLKQERRAMMHSQIIQNYVIFFVFLIVLVVIQNFLIPYMSKVGSVSVFGVGAFSPFNTPQMARLSFSSFNAFKLSAPNWFLSLNGIFLMMALIQGFFAGIVTGLMTEGDFRYGLKHSLILMVVSFFIMALSQAFV